MESTREIIRRFYEEIWNRKDFSAIERLCAKDFTFRGSLGAVERGRRGFEEYVREVTGALGEYRCEIEQLVVENERAFAKMLFSGLHRGTLLGFPPTNRRVAWAGAALFTLRDAQIANLWVLGDLHGLIHQLEKK